MLKHLSIRNFILIDALDMELTGGFYAITGETGAGKSILQEAIFFCLGGKFDAQVVKQGREFCSVSIEFDLPEVLRPLLHSHGIEIEEQTLIIKRHQTRANRKKYLVNDQLVTPKFVMALGEHLIEIHGQHGADGLLSITSHSSILDRYGDLGVAVRELRQVYEQWQQYRQAIAALEREQSLIEREINYVSFVVQELSALKLSVGEEEQLLEQRRLLQVQEKNNALLVNVLAALRENEIKAHLQAARRVIYKQDSQGRLEELAHTLDDLVLSLEGISGELSARLEKNKGGSLDEIEDRLFAIRAMARKHQVAGGELASFLAAQQARCAELQEKLAARVHLDTSCGRFYEEYCRLAAALSQQRKLIARSLEEKVAVELAQLMMPGAQLTVEILPRLSSQGTAQGIDAVRFVGCTNKGSPLVPIDTIASGGELARFMLALKVVLFDKLSKPTIIFDEIDSGLGGMVADVVGERLRALGTVAQVFAITHQAQVAGKAAHHLCVSKQSSKGETLSQAVLLSREGRIEELARMISGRIISPESRRAAAFLL